MPLSQRLIHTRVYGQMIAVLSTVSVMAFVKEWKRTAALQIVDGQLVRGEQGRRPRNWYSSTRRHRRRLVSASTKNEGGR